jgi:hypothetical protein
MDREAGWAHFRTYVRDVLGNEATMYGSESARDFGDFSEKASTKSLGRALLALGYGTAFAPEMDEGERVVDSPVDRHQPVRPARPMTAAPTATMSAPRELPAVPPSQAVGDEPMATEKQVASIRKLCEALGKPEPNPEMTYSRARELITQLSGEYQRARRAS